MEKKGWKVLAICFIVFSGLLLLTLIGAYSLGSQSIENENKCAYDICNPTTESYLYDDEHSVCQCYVNNEVVYSAYID